MEALEIAQVVGWVLTLVPAAVFLTISMAMVKGVGSEDDPLIMGIAMFGLTVFLLGVVLLVIAYLTNLLQTNLDQEVSDAILVVIKILGWLFAVPPPIIFVSVSAGLAYKIGKKDAVIGRIATGGLTIFLLGVSTLLVTYFFL